MFPPFVYWAPQIHFPLSGDVAQRIEPELVMNAITPAATNREVEKRVLTDISSYGQQLGLITELLLDLAAQVAPVTPAGIEAHDRLSDIARRVEALKP
jgi:hypothetical protein